MPAIGVVTAISNPALEAVVIRALAGAAEQVQVVRRCVEVSDVLAVAASGQARAVIIGDSLPGVDADIVARIAAHGVVAIALVEAQHSWPGARLFPVVLDSSSDPRTLASQIVAAARAGVDVRPPPPAATQPAASSASGASSGAPDATVPGRVIAVWGPAGAPGRSTVALGIADEIARLRQPTLLVDADPYGGALGAMLGLLDESPGIAAACRAAASGTLDAAGLARTCLQVSPQLRVLTGISRGDRWPELRPSSLEIVLQCARELGAVTVIDCGFSIEEDEELSYDTLAPRRNGATTTALRLADEVLLVSGCDPVSVARGVRAAQELRDGLDLPAPRLVINKVRSGVLRGDARTQLDDAFERYAGLRTDALLPLDVKGCDAALLHGRTLAEAAPSSALRLATIDLARRLVPDALPATGRRRGVLRR